LGGVDRVVVVGAGLAGMQTVLALRRQGYDGSLVLLGAERHPPYDRPPLSKSILLGKAEDVDLPFDTVALRADLRLGTAATALRDGVVETSAGELPYDGLVIATGSEPVRLPGAGALYLRTRDDSHALREKLLAGGRVVIVGAGWIGAEVATAAAAYGCQVTVVEQAATPVSHALPPEVGGHFAAWYAQAGVELLLGERVELVRPDGVDLVGGRSVPADVVVVGVGVRPATGWLEGSAVELDRGVLVGPDLATSVPGVFAVGDSVARWSPRYDTRIRGEHWDDALRAPAVVAGNLLGAREAYDPVPYVWSEQFGRMVTYAGHPAAGERLVWRGSPGEPSWAVCWLTATNELAAVLAVDRPRDFVQGRKLAEARTPVDPDKLADTSVNVRAAVAG
jgi:3-phenylpropionate/trans-cinnamate dioxygenase ferredoxin reductase subunit